jgi:hypothetical protein
VPSLLAAGLVAVLALASAAGSPVLAAGIVLVQGVFALGAVRQAGVPGAVVAAWLALGVGVGTSVWLVADDIPELTPMARLLAAAFLLAIVLQLWRRHGRPMLTASLSVTVAAVVLAALPASLVALRTAEAGAYAVGLGLLGVGVVLVVDGVGGRSVLARMLAVLVAGAAAALLVMLVSFGDVPEVGAVVLAAFGALLAVAALYAVDRLAAESASGQERAGSAGDVLELVAVDARPLQLTLPIIMAAPVIYILGRLLIG